MSRPAGPGPPPPSVFRSAYDLEGGVVAGFDSVTVEFTHPVTKGDQLQRLEASAEPFQVLVRAQDEHVKYSQAAAAVEQAGSAREAAAADLEAYVSGGRQDQRRRRVQRPAQDERLDVLEEALREAAAAEEEARALYWKGPLVAIGALVNEFQDTPAYERVLNLEQNQPALHAQDGKGTSVSRLRGRLSREQAWLAWKRFLVRRKREVGDGAVNEERAQRRGRGGGRGLHSIMTAKRQEHVHSTAANASVYAWASSMRVSYFSRAIINDNPHRCMSEYPPVRDARHAAAAPPQPDATAEVYAWSTSDTGATVALPAHLWAFLVVRLDEKPAAPADAYQDRVADSGQAARLAHGVPYVSAFQTKAIHSFPGTCTAEELNNMATAPADYWPGVHKYMRCTRRGRYIFRQPTLWRTEMFEVRDMSIAHGLFPPECVLRRLTCRQLESSAGLLLGVQHSRWAAVVTQEF